MMKKLLFILILIPFLFMPIGVWSACVESPSNTWTCDASYTSLSALMSNAALDAGDIINVNSGTQTWSSTLVVQKNVIFRGAGIGNTNITCSAGCFDLDKSNYDDTASRTGNVKFEVSGFTFTGGSAEGVYMHEDDAETTPFTNIVIANNRFTGFSGNAIYIKGHFWGIAYGNQFNNVRAMTFLANHRYSWDTFGAYTPGSANNFYIEDNTFTSTTNFYVNSGHGGRYAFRYNTFGTSFTFDSPMWDQHGCQTAIWSLMGCELYGNLITATSRYWWEYIRGGKLMFFNNRMTAGSGPEQITEVQYNYYCQDSANAPVNDAAVSVQKPNNVYVWNNWVNSTNQVMENTTDCDTYPTMCASHPLYENTDFFNQPTAITCGSATPTGSCTTGYGYWKTSYSPCSTPPATIADKPGVPTLLPIPIPIH
jgi:hypothetical protein